MSESTRPIHLARFKNVKDTDPLHQTGDWKQLRPHLTQHKPVRVELTDEILADPALLKARLDAVKLRGPAISPAIYSDEAKRGNSGIQAMTCFIADIDDGTPYAQLAERWKTPDGKPLAWALFSTFKSRTSAPRYRVVFPLAIDVPAAQWLATWRKLGYWLTDDHIDPSTKDPARLHFLPACPAQWLDEAFSDFSDGELLDPAMFDDPPAGADDTDEAIAARVRAIRASGNHEATGSGEGRPGDDFNRRATVESIAALLLESGGKEERRNGDAILLTRPGKHDGVSGVVGFPGDPAPIFYCWSSNWSGFEPGRSYDAFGVLARVKHAGIFEDAARQLGSQGFGEQPAQRQAREATKRYVQPPVSPPGKSRSNKGKKNSEPEREKPLPTPEPFQFKLDDIGNGQRLIFRHGENLRYSPALGWLVWNGQRWEPDDSGEVDRLAKETARSIFLESAEVKQGSAEILVRVAGESDEAKAKELTDQAAAIDAQAAAIAAWARKSADGTRRREMIAAARTEPGVYVAVQELDTDPLLLNVQNGTIDLRTGELRPHDRADLITHIGKTPFDPDALAPTWERFMERILPDPEVRAYVQRLFGYGLTADVSEQILPFFYGEGRNGKSTCVKALMTLLGDFAQQAPGELLLEKPAGSIPNDVAGLRGARFVATIEVTDGRRMAEGLVKQLTGGDAIRARFMRGEFFQFEPTFKIFLIANHRPEVHGSDFAIWRRIKVVPFTETIPDDEVDTRLPEKLRAELPGILAYAVRGCLDWQSGGLQEPTAVQIGTEEYRADSDVLGGFIEDRCVLHLTARVRSFQLYAEYTGWCGESGHRPMSQTKFGIRMGSRQGIEREKSGGNWYAGIGLKADMGELGGLGGESPITPKSKHTQETHMGSASQPSQASLKGPTESLTELSEAPEVRGLRGLITPPSAQEAGGQSIDTRKTHMYREGAENSANPALAVRRTVL